MLTFRLWINVWINSINKILIKNHFLKKGLITRIEIFRALNQNWPGLCWRMFSENQRYVSSKKEHSFIEVSCDPVKTNWKLYILKPPNKTWISLNWLFDGTVNSIWSLAWVQGIESNQHLRIHIQYSKYPYFHAFVGVPNNSSSKFKDDFTRLEYEVWVGDSQGHQIVVNYIFIHSKSWVFGPMREILQKNVGKVLVLSMFFWITILW